MPNYLIIKSLLNKKKGQNIEWLADQVGLSRPRMSEIINGGTTTHAREKKIAQVLGVPVSIFYDDDRTVNEVFTDNVEILADRAPDFNMDEIVNSPGSGGNIKSRGFIEIEGEIFIHSSIADMSDVEVVKEIESLREEIGFLKRQLQSKGGSDYVDLIANKTKIEFLKELLDEKTRETLELKEKLDRIMGGGRHPEDDVQAM